MTEIVASETPTSSSWWQKWLGREKLTEIEVIFFGLAIVLGNRNFFWNQGLVYGYEAVAVNTLFVGSAFFCLCLCMGEMSSALPFSGGIFGFVRAATGPYYGFVVACFEVIFCLANLVVIVPLCVPRKSIPRAMVLCATELVCFSVFITLAACSTYPGQAILQQTLVPLIFGYKDIFKIDLIDAIWLHLPGLFAPTLATLYCSGRQLYMIAKSGMLPRFFATSTPHTGTPAVALIFATSVGIAIDLATYYNPDVLYHIINISLISSHIIFINAFIAYFFFVQKYTSLPRSFRNPFGIWGAIYGLINNLIGCISVILYNSNDNVSYSLYVMIGYFVIVTLLYFLYLGKRQIFSAEEKKLMFKAYLINANRDKQRRIFRGNNKGPKTPITRKPSTRALYEEAPPDLQNENVLEDPTTRLSRRGVEQRSENSVSTSRHDQSSVRNAVAYAGKVLHDLGTKMSVVVPVTSDELTEYQQLIILSAGGAIDPSEELALQESLGIHENEIEKEDDKDIESSSFIFEASL